MQAAFAATLLGLALAASACVDDAKPPVHGTTDDPPAAETSTQGTQTAGETGSASSSTSGSESETASSGSPLLPNGGTCEENADCTSQACLSLPPLSNNICSECLEDRDCDGVCSFSLADPTTPYFHCRDGVLGEICSLENDGCNDGLMCTFFDFGGWLPADTPKGFCSACGSNVDCRDGDICTPRHNFPISLGWFDCVAPGSVETNQLCTNVDGKPDPTVCQSGHCTMADFFDFFGEDGSIALCGECTTDTDCPKGESCVPASVDSGIEGAHCEPAR